MSPKAQEVSEIRFVSALVHALLTDNMNMRYVYIGAMLHEQGDFKIRAGEGLPAVTVHKSILAARSGFFRALLESGMGDAKHGELTLKVGMHAPQHACILFCKHAGNYPVLL